MQGAGEAVAEAIGRARAAIDDLADCGLLALSDGESRQLVTELCGQLNRMHAQLVRGMANLAARPGAVPLARPGKELPDFLVYKAHMSPGQAWAYLRVIDLSEILPQTMTAFQDGRLSFDHVACLARALSQISERAKTTESLPRLDAWLLANLTRFTPDEVRRLARRVREVLTPNRADGSATPSLADFDRRGMSTSMDRDGMTLFVGQADPLTAASILHAMEHFGRPRLGSGVAEDGSPVSLPDRRSKATRSMDGLAEACRIALEVAGTEHDPRDAGERTGGRTRPLVIFPASAEAVRAAMTGQPGAGLADCDTTGPLTGGHLGVFACDALLQRAIIAPETGAVLNLGRTVRTVSDAQRAVLRVRDRGCVIPGCDAPASWCDGHHVRWWRNSGRTDLDNLCLLCARHHTEVHAGRWELVMVDGRPWVRPPRWVDDLQRLIRNMLHDDIAHAERLAQQLRLDLDRGGPPDHPPGHPHGGTRVPPDSGG